MDDETVTTWRIAPTYEEQTLRHKIGWLIIRFGMWFMDAKKIEGDG